MSSVDIFLILFIIAMIANVIALVRFWRMMRMTKIVLENFVETQEQFNAILEREQ